jgi:hypothetical protein
MTTWQPKAVEAMCRTQYADGIWDKLSEDSDGKHLTRREMEAALRAALPLIEVTTRMEAAACYADATVAEEFKAMLRACTTEGNDQ